MRFIGFEREQDAIKWARRRIGAKGGGFCRAVSAVDGKDRFCCVMVLSGFSPCNIDVHVAAVDGFKWATPTAFVEMYNFVLNYVFVLHKALRATALIRAGNTKAIDFVLKLGFTHEGRMRKAFNGEDLCIYGILEEDFKNHKWYRSQ